MLFGSFVFLCSFGFCHGSVGIIDDGGGWVCQVGHLCLCVWMWCYCAACWVFDDGVYVGVDVGELVKINGVIECVNHDGCFIVLIPF